MQKTTITKIQTDFYYNISDYSRKIKKSRRTVRKMIDNSILDSVDVEGKIYVKERCWVELDQGIDIKV